MKNTLGLVVVVKDGAKHMGKVLRQGGLYADRIFVFVDSASSDNTYDVCEPLCDHIELIDTGGYIESVLEYVYSVPDTTHILRLDSDELVGERFIANLDDILSRPVDAVWMPRYAMVSPFKYLSDKPMYPDMQLRLFRKGKITPRTIIHNTPEINGPAADVNTHIFHMKFLWRGRAEREALAKHYDEIASGAGSLPEYAAHQVPEQHYRGVVSFIDEWPVDPDVKVLNLGCGQRPRKYATNVDSVDVPAWYPDKFEGVEFTQHNLNSIHWPWPDGAFEEVVMDDVLEHLKADSLDIFNELWRVLKPGGILRIKCPDASQPGVFQDMTHTKFFIKDSFWHLDPDHLYGEEFNHYTPFKWKILRAENAGNTGSFIVWMQKR